MTPNDPDKTRQDRTTQEKRREEQRRQEKRREREREVKDSIVVSSYYRMIVLSHDSSYSMVIL